MTSTTQKFTYEQGKIYEFTLNPKDDFQKFEILGENRYRCFMENMYNRICTKLEKCCDFYLVPEISEPQASGPHNKYKPRLHLHGIIRIYDKMTFLIEVLYTIGWIGMYQFNEYRGKEWLTYIKKDKTLMEIYARKKRVKGKPKWYRLHNDNGKTMYEGEHKKRLKKPAEPEGIIITRDEETGIMG